ncbi:hypothetical protein A2641_03745 [Candidatus Nomurabacteria bacterium RIFCSPHIGHO2_01_FULL_37_25]|uniref:Death-on-curing protein n=1 Tax=Candidatus Nomurabacteria bacterium RIFCSPLOWO2_01_FULL_36_16 TaxID=1801767 RepID=A0A1F6WY50_9BACT|nr:MAG: hypothetical protein A2641_03745 [Candidatus Nomurabacteria bacterium RIFCSPHIGHO2_01_FULL_37_25]OGI75147.1 MAG: hypothetical protein A3D36_00900 [Candidatus Nomurabacteria bacterium RIFCSPHIGHO2_02_FULL_36_29]OGI86802.1 MAG: hypothetical protein A3A91_01110 [Candidatus Nomurabacteria bacterium RIFCSPLOWO2_01_FULL_36_16]OGI95282.1 MAG: hypothetical protein A3I84_01670 [Candidatus Nomurabacteria bacterium RIFCSPLOWO2_02_FULL_36_8]
MKKYQEKIKNNIVIYQTPSGSIEFRGDFEKETMWANLNQIAQVFGVQKATISKHLKNIYETEELTKNATVSKMETVQVEGNRSVSRLIALVTQLLK